MLIKSVFVIINENIDSDNRNNFYFKVGNNADQFVNPICAEVYEKSGWYECDNVLSGIYFLIQLIYGPNIMNMNLI